MSLDEFLSSSLSLSLTELSLSSERLACWQFHNWLLSLLQSLRFVFFQFYLVALRRDAKISLESNWMAFSIFLSSTTVVWFMGFYLCVTVVKSSREMKWKTFCNVRLPIIEACKEAHRRKIQLSNLIANEKVRVVKEPFARSFTNCFIGLYFC